MPIEYTLLSTYPDVRVEYPDFQPVPGSSIKTFYTSSQVTIQGINKYPALTPFRILMKGVRNPNSATVLHNWNVLVLIGDFLVDRQNNFAAFSLDDVYVPRTITVNKISSLPDNEGVTADYYFSFTPRSKLGSGAEISIKFPSQYRILPSSPECSVSGALNTFSDCATNLNSIVLTTDSEYTQGTINIKIDRIRNPISGETSVFEVETKYDGQVVDSIDEVALRSNTLQIKSKPDKLLV